VLLTDTYTYCWHISVWDITQLLRPKCKVFEIFHGLFTLRNVEGVRCNILRKFWWNSSQFNLSVLRSSSVAPTSRVPISAPLYSMECIEKCAVRRHPHVKIILLKFRVEFKSTRKDVASIILVFLHERCWLIFRELT